MTLRRRLVVGMLLLLVAGLITTDLLTSSSLRSFLLGRLDDQLDVSQGQAYNYIYQVYERDLQSGVRTPLTDPRAWLADLAAPLPVSVPSGASASAAGQAGTGRTGADQAGATPSSSAAPPRALRLNPGALAGRLSSDAYVEVISANGKVLFRDPSGPVGNPDAAPVLPARLAVQHLPAFHVPGRNHGPYAPESPSFDVAAVGSPGLHYRAQAVAVPGGVLITAISLDPTEETLASLTHIEVFVSFAVSVALLLLALWIVRIGMRPLDDMTETAGAIARGDLTRRIRRAEVHSEVGRLGTALNGMLSQIEAAFRERTRSESRLRRFVADASHELRTPLTSIRGYAELLRKGAFDSEDERRRAAERIENEAARMSLLVDDLLLLARLDQGRPLEQTPVDLCHVVSDAVDATRVHDTGRTITLDTDGAVVVAGDADRLRQIVDNLLRNAVVHTPAGTPVQVSVQRRHQTAVLRVADEGPGLDPEQAARVFDRFYRGSQARTGEGTGLGLSIVAALANAHGGRATINTAPGVGTALTVEIPLAPPAGETPHDTAPVAVGRVPGGAGGAGPVEGAPEEDSTVPADGAGPTDDASLAPSLRR